MITDSNNPTARKFNVIRVGTLDHIKEIISKGSVDFDKDNYETAMIWYAFFFLIKYYVVQSSVNSPFETIDIKDRPINIVNGKKKRYEGALHKFSRTVHLTERFKYKQRHASETSGSLDKEGRHQESREIAGYIRLQHYGERNSLTKTIFVNGFTRNYWLLDNFKVSTYVKK